MKRGLTLIIITLLLTTTVMYGKARKAVVFHSDGQAVSAVKSTEINSKTETKTKATPQEVPSISNEETEKTQENKVKNLTSYNGEENIFSVTEQPANPVLTISAQTLLSNVLVGPNPVNVNQESVTLQYQLSKDAEVDLYIFSISGEQIWTRSFLSGDPTGGMTGVNKVLWSGLNKYGHKVASGPYILYAMARSGHEKKRAKAKIMVLK